MKIAIYSPNLTRNSGGAEVYAIRMAENLKKTNEVVIFTSPLRGKKKNIKSIYNHYGVDYINTKYIRRLFLYLPIAIDITTYLQGKLLEKALKGKFDCFINCTQGKLRGINGVKSIHLIHFPDTPYAKFYPLKMRSKWNERYVSSYDSFWANSYFTNKYLKSYWGVNGKVLYPPIAMQVSDEVLDKENIILAVDRLVPDKKICEMINAFKSFYAQTNKKYKLVVVGNRDSKHKGYYEKIRKEIEEYPIEIHSNVPYGELVRWYQRARMFWHAKGFEVDENEPSKMEHFGMTTVEAMANGCIPIVIDKAGQKEIVSHGEDGFKWKTLKELVDYSIDIENNKDRALEMSRKAIEKAKRFTINSFRDNLFKLMEE